MYYQIENTNVRLAGSMHIVPRGSPLPSWAQDAYQWCTELCLEADLGAGLGDGRFLPNGQSAQTRFLADTWALIKNEMPDEPVERLKPWTIVLGIARKRLSNAIALDHGVDTQLFEQAARDKKPIHYLESAAELCAVGDTIGDEACAEAVPRIVNNQKDLGAMMRASYDAWIAGDPLATQQAFPQMAPEVQEALLVMRNQLWLPRILGLLRSHKRTLIVVGVLHLPGQSGLLELLRANGHETTRLI